MTDPSTRVCPRCGNAAGQSEYCGTCGLHLFEQPELPTHADWEATQATKEGASARLPDPGSSDMGRAAGRGSAD